MRRKLLSLFSICQRAGKLKSGEMVCEKALGNGEAKLIIVCGDASDNTKKKFEQKTFYYKIPYFSILSKAELNAATGKENRATFAVTDNGFANRMIELINGIMAEDNIVSEHNPEVDICPN